MDERERIYLILSQIDKRLDAIVLQMTNRVEELKRTIDVLKEALTDNEDWIKQTQEISGTLDPRTVQIAHTAASQEVSEDSECME